jgi:hypothetical protein
LSDLNWSRRTGRARLPTVRVGVPYLQIATRSIKSACAQQRRPGHARIYTEAGMRLPRIRLPLKEKKEKKITVCCVSLRPLHISRKPVLPWEPEVPFISYNRQTDRGAAFASCVNKIAKDTTLHPHQEEATYHRRKLKLSQIGNGGGAPTRSEEAVW